MSVWSTKASGIGRDYIVLQHTLKGVNHTINGIKFRESYAVVEKNSKVYFNLKKVPVLRASKEYPLLHLKKLPFITRTADIRTVYGQDVYIKFLEAEQQAIEDAKQAKEQIREDAVQKREEVLEKVKEAEAEGNLELVEELKTEIPEIKHCCYRTKEGLLCKDPAQDYSISNYCHKHIFEEPILKELGLELPKFLTKKEIKIHREKVKTALKKYKKEHNI